MAKLWRCAFRSTLSDGTLVVNTFHKVDRAGIGIGDLSASDIGDALVSSLGTRYRGMFMSDATVHDLTVTEQTLPGGGAVPEQSVKVIELAGTRSPVSKTLPPSMTPLATLKSNAAVRGGRGRLWLPPPLSSSYLDAPGVWNTLVNGASAGWKLFLDQLVTDESVGTIDVHTLSLVVYSPTRHLRALPDYYFDADVYDLHTKPHWLRSRSSIP